MFSRYLCGSRIHVTYPRVDLTFRRAAPDDAIGAWTFPIPMLRDIASLAKIEVTTSDCWSIIHPDYAVTPADEVMLDDAAALLNSADDLWAATQAVYQKYPQLKVQSPLMAWDWATDKMSEYDIAAEIA